MSPDSERLLSYPGRGPRMAYQDAAHMAWDMDRLAAYYPSKRQSRDLPKVANYRLALNIAACDGLPLVVVSSQEWEQRLARLSWSSQNLGKAVYVRGPRKGNSEAYVVRPGQFGLQGTKVAELPSDLTASQLSKILDRHRTPPKDYRRQIWEGRRKGVHWETAVPVTDPGGRPF